MEGWRDIVVVEVVVFIILLGYTQQAYSLLTGCPRRNCEQLALKASKIRWNRMIVGSALKRLAPINERMDGMRDRGIEGWIDGWMDGWKDGWKDGWTDGRMDGRMDGRISGWMEGWRNGGMVGWRDGWMDGSMDGRMDGWTDGWMDG